MNSLRLCTTRMVRNFGTSSKNLRSMAELKEIQRRFQVDDGVPVFLKRGSTDKVFFSVICIGLGICLADAITTVYKIIYPPKPSS
ncbi:uncharacterized protein CDAR_188841 [Caerostris darwini]|uniref:Uncharacterized protein n=1 Tax=Caerostris darwini TaxID=1538125 RepID=A0AAV4VY44_9ARAC|nr:uncharacterized protein CDAR_188841 [Caerostris darwini]